MASQIPPGDIAVPYRPLTVAAGTGRGGTAARGVQDGMAGEAHVAGISRIV